MKNVRIAAAAACLALSTGAASAADEAGGSWFSGDYDLTLGVSTFAAPRFEGANKYEFNFQPLFSIGRAGTQKRFTSRNDNISLPFIDTGDFRAGVTGKIVFPRDQDDAPGLAGLHEVDWGAELGGFAEYYPTNWLRLRGELRRGIHAHDAFVGDLAVDAFTDLTPVLRLSGGPRLSFASEDYFDTYYGVSAAEAAATGLDRYDPDGGFRSAGFGGALAWQTTDRIETSLFGEYERLLGPAADSSLVEQNGSPNQFTVGVSATYTFGFTIR